MLTASESDTCKVISVNVLCTRVRPLVVCSLIAGLAMGQAPAAGPSFDAFRLHSGMTPDEVSKEFQNYELRWLAKPRGAAMLVQRPVNLDDPDICASLSFCNNRLVSIIRTVDPDTDFLTYAQDYLREYGQPSVNVRKQPWTGKNGGDITALELIWIGGGIRREVTLSPKGEPERVNSDTIAARLWGIRFDTPCR
jgi:hypothetical protein